jgi:hypothetical protein
VGVETDGNTAEDGVDSLLYGRRPDAVEDFQNAGTQPFDGALAGSVVIQEEVGHFMG